MKLITQCDNLKLLIRVNTTTTLTIMNNESSFRFLYLEDVMALCMNSKRL